MQFARFQEESGLWSILNAIDSQPEGVSYAVMALPFCTHPSVAKTPLSRLPPASSQAVSSALGEFDRFLSTLDVSSSPRLGSLTVSRLASSIHSDAIHKIGLAYNRVCDAVRKPENRYEFAGTLLGSRRPFGDMRVLWQVLGIDDSEI